MIRRRRFIGLLGGAAAWPLAARAQQSGKPIPTIGYFSARSPETDALYLAAFRRGLAETGHAEGRNVAIEFRWANGRYDLLPELAQDLVRRQVAVVVTSGGELPASAAKSATSTIPILFVGGRDPVRTGLVSSLNRPGGNVTGVVTFLESLTTKLLGLLRDLVPSAGTIAFLINPSEPTAELQIRDVQAAARSVGQPLVVLPAATEGDIDSAFEALVRQRVGALIVGVGPYYITRTDQLVGLAARYALPTIYFRREFAAAGGLMSYGSSAPEAYHQLGIYAGRILKGERPADLPVVQSARFELVINLRTARTLGLAVPPGLMAIADEVIE
jgi:putative ABC transport system substrate-binding protein